MAYTPELSQSGSATLTRLAWYMWKPMTKSLEMLVQRTAKKMAEVKPGEICSMCRDDSICEWGPFNSHFERYSPGAIYAKQRIEES